MLPFQALRMRLSGGVLPITIAVQDFQSGTTTGVVNYTTATLSGKDTRAALIFGTRQIVADEPGETVSAQISVTFMSELGGQHFRTLSQDGVANTNTSRNFTNAADVRGFNSAASALNYSGIATPISGGVSINWGTASTNHRLFYVAFAGSSIVKSSGDTNLGTGTSAITVSLTGSYTPDLVIIGGVNAPSDGNFFTYSFGLALKDGTQRFVSGGEGQALAVGTPFQSIVTDRCAGQISSTDGSLTYTVTASNFVDGSIDFTPSANAGSDVIQFLALKLPGCQLAIRDFTTPTATGNSSITGVGFEPDFALLVLTNLETTYTAAGHPGTQTSGDLMSGFSICAIGDEQWSFAIRIDGGAATTDTATQTKNVAVLGASATSCAAIEATLVSFDADGMTLNYSAVQGTGKKGFILFIKTPS